MNVKWLEKKILQSVSRGRICLQIESLGLACSSVPSTVDRSSRTAGTSRAVRRTALPAGVRRVKRMSGPRGARRPIERDPKSTTVPGAARQTSTARRQSVGRRSVHDGGLTARCCLESNLACLHSTTALDDPIYSGFSTDDRHGQADGTFQRWIVHRPQRTCLGSPCAAASSAELAPLGPFPRCIPGIVRAITAMIPCFPAGARLGFRHG